MTTRVRFAPSPTGYLHIGSARTALFNYLFAKKTNGKYILRIEDTDLLRNVKGSEEMLLRDLRWLGLNWDEGPDCGGDFGPYRSSERLAIYNKYVNKLLDEGKAYFCFCAKEELEQVRDSLASRFFCKCCNLSDELILKFKKENKPFSIRFRVPVEDKIVFDDIIRGEVSFALEDIEDFIIFKSNGMPTYHFAVTVDDALMRITHVIRGEEHLSNTPKHILLFKALNFPLPHFAHIPLILNKDGRKLSKRDKNTLQFISEYRELGYLPSAIINYLSLLGWSPSGEFLEREIFSLDELQKLFSLYKVSKAPAIFDLEKMTWINSQYIKKVDVSLLVDMSLKYLKDKFTYKEIEELVLLFKNNLLKVADIESLTKIFWQKEVNYTKEALLFLKENFKVLNLFILKLKNLDVFSLENIKNLLKELQLELQKSAKEVFLPLRVAFTGEFKGPDLSRVLFFLGKEGILARFEKIKVS